MAAPDEEDRLYGALLTLNSATVRAVLDEYRGIRTRPKYAGSVLHDLLQETSSSEFSRCRHRRTIMHMLTFAGLDTNAVDEDGNTALHVVALRFSGDAEVAEPLIQAGASLSQPNSSGKSVLDMVLNSGSIPTEVVELFKKYSPGLWRAVVTDDLLSVRKLINLWCRVDITKDGMTLKEKALEMGTEHIIRLIKEMEVSMRLAHSILAEDYNSAEHIVTSSKKDKVTLNLDLKNLGDMGATPLFYAILQNDARLVQLLCEHGARPDAMITLQDEDIPILYAALHKEADPEMIKYLVPPRKDSTLPLYSLHYRRNQCARDLAVLAGKAEYVATIDEAVYDWYLDVNDENRKVLALMGYTHIREAAKDGVRACEVVQSMETSSPQAQFDTQLVQYQEQVEQLAAAVEAGNLQQVKALLTFTSLHQDCFISCLADSRAKGDGQPLLHKAVLRHDTAVIDLLAGTLTKVLHLRLDDVRDQCMRTALHYAYALPHGKPLVGLLLDYGASEFTMDKDFRSPLVFKDFRGQPDMDKLLLWHTDQLCMEPEPDPWSKRLPPILQAIKAQGCSSEEFVLRQAATQGGGCCPNKTPAPPRATWGAYCAIL